MDVIFCRYCGASIVGDSLFCAKCGKRLGKRSNPQVERIVSKLRLKTPYPYFALLLFSYIIWTIGPRGSHVDYSKIKWTLEVEKKLDDAENHTFQQNYSLILENTGDSVVRDVPVDLLAKLDPPQSTADIIAGFLGRRLLILQQGKTLPLTVILADPVQPHEKRRYYLDASIDANPPFKAVLEIHPESSRSVLASQTIER